MMFNLKKPVVDIAIVCSDFDESLQFFRDKLGLEIAMEITIPSETATAAGLAPRGFHQVRLRAGETLIKLVQIEQPPATRRDDFQSGIRWLTLIVEDVAKTFELLRAKGVEFVSEPVPAPDAPAIVCAKAPDGLLIEFVQLPDA